MSKPGNLLGLPPLPIDLNDIFFCLKAAPPQTQSLVSHLNDHARELAKFADDLRLSVMDRPGNSARKGLRAHRSGLDREFQAALKSSGLRQRIWVLLELCLQLAVPPTRALLALVADLDAPERGPGTPSFLKPIHLVAWYRATGIFANFKAKGESVSKSELAGRAQVPLSMIRGWMEKEEWTRAVDSWVDIERHGSAHTHFR